MRRFINLIESAYSAKLARMIINEMNVVNIDSVKTDFSKLLLRTAKDLDFTIPKPIFDLLVKRAVKAMQNDDAGHMILRNPFDKILVHPEF